MARAYESFFCPRITKSYGGEELRVMATFEMSPEEEELAKKDRLINAWFAVGEDASPGDIADVTGASPAYASRIRSELTEGEIPEEEVEDIRDDQLVDEYAARLDQLAQDETEETEDETEADMEQPADEEPEPTAEPEHPQEPRQESAHQQAPPRQQPQQAQRPPQQGQQPPQRTPPRQQSQPAPQSQHSQQVQQSQQEGLAGEQGQTIPVEQLVELDEMLAFIQDEAHFELQNLPPQDRGAAAGKLFVAQQARGALHSIVSETGQQE